MIFPNREHAKRSLPHEVFVAEFFMDAPIFNVERDVKILSWLNSITQPW